MSLGGNEKRMMRPHGRTGGTVPKAASDPLMPIELD
jgi:hypothetical protein